MADSCVLGSLVFWNSTERLANWGDHLHTQKRDRSERLKYWGVPLLNLPGKVYAMCLEKQCQEMIEPKLDDTQCSFCPGRSTTDEIFTLQQIFEKS